MIAGPRLRGSLSSSIIDADRLTIEEMLPRGRYFTVPVAVSAASRLHVWQRHGQRSRWRHGDLHGLTGVDQRYVHQVLGQEPHLKLVLANDVAHEQIVGAVVAGGLRTPRGFVRELQDQLVGLQ